ncbi:MAG: hypothetical protein IPH02_00330 [Sphingobacteriales bacterium]|nr:hypothetical protein [Sphingobacteriales bacterium]
MNDKIKYEVERLIRQLMSARTEEFNKTEDIIINWYKKQFNDRNIRYDTWKWKSFHLETSMSSSKENDFFLKQKRERESLHQKQILEYDKMKELTSQNDALNLVLIKERSLREKHIQEAKILYNKLENECKVNRFINFKYSTLYNEIPYVQKGANFMLIGIGMIVFGIYLFFATTMTLLNIRLGFYLISIGAMLLLGKDAINAWAFIVLIVFFFFNSGGCGIKESWGNWVFVILMLVLSTKIKNSLYKENY